MRPNDFFVQVDPETRPIRHPNRSVLESFLWTHDLRPPRGFAPLEFEQARKFFSTAQT
jgi:hypothetical protein